MLTLVRGPQAFRLALAPMTNDFVALLKDSSLVSVLTVVELTKQTQIFADQHRQLGDSRRALRGAVSRDVAAARALARRLEQRWKAPHGMSDAGASTSTTLQPAARRARRCCAA